MEQELPAKVLQALEDIANASTVGEARRAASSAYVDNRAPCIGQSEVQTAMIAARERLGQDSPGVGVQAYHGLGCGALNRTALCSCG